MKVNNPLREHERLNLEKKFNNATFSEIMNFSNWRDEFNEKYNSNYAIFWNKIKSRKGDYYKIEFKRS